MVENVTIMTFKPFSLNLTVLDCHFLCVIHGPENWMKCMNNALDAEISVSHDFIVF